jgi:hypothetical protein
MVMEDTGISFFIQKETEMANWIDTLNFRINQLPISSTRYRFTPKQSHTRSLLYKILSIVFIGPFLCQSRRMVTVPTQTIMRPVDIERQEAAATYPSY